MDREPSIGNEVAPKTDHDVPAKGVITTNAERQNILKNAIIEGEAYALGFKGPLGSVAVVLSAVKRRTKDVFGQQTDLVDLLARSFGGARTDIFIVNRIPDVHMRVAGTFISKSPRRGFDAVVEALRELQPDLGNTYDDAAAAVAHLLAAAPDDQVVRNIVARLHALLVPEVGKG